MQLQGSRRLAQQHDTHRRHDENLEVCQQRRQARADVVDAAVPEPEVEREKHRRQQQHLPGAPRQLQPPTGNDQVHGKRHPPIRTR